MKLEEIRYKDYLISNNKDMLSIERIYALLSRSYWAAKRPKEVVAESIRHSGYLRCSFVI